MLDSDPVLKMRAIDLWNGLDRLAAANRFTASGLARAAGLNSTTFNRSKRIIGGRPRWPSTESIALVLNAVGITLTEFAAIVEEAALERRPPRASRRRPD